MGHFSDALHMDTCAGKYCNTMELRSNMRKIEGRRGWFCDRCWPKTRPKKNRETS